MVARRSPRKRENRESNLVLPEPSHAIDLNIGTQAAALSGVWRWRISTNTGWPAVSILCADGLDRLLSQCRSTYSC